MEWLIAGIESVYKRQLPIISLTSWRKQEMKPVDIYWAAKTLFFIEEHDKIEDLDLKNLKPFVIFQIRQVLEIFGKKLLGYNSIQDKNGNSIKKFTQISWEFINYETKKTNSRIELPFDSSIITLINKWANIFVHSTFLYNSYVQYFALETIYFLFSSNSTNGFKIYNDEILLKNQCADIKIKNYESLKTDFEDFLKEKINLKEKIKSIEISVDWMSPHETESYIVSL